MLPEVLAEINPLEYQDRARFPLALERAFRQDFYQNSVNYVRAAILTVTLPIAAFLILDVSAAPQSWPIFWGIRAVMVTLLSLIPIAFRFQQLQRFFIWISTLAALVFVLGVSMMIALSQPQEAAFSFYYIGLVIAAVGAPATFGLLFRQSVALGVSIVLIYSLIAIEAQNLLATTAGRVDFQVACFFLVGATVTGIISGYFNEKRHRRDFLQRCLIEQQRAEAERLRHQSDRLLLNILPSEIASRLKENPQIIAEDFAQASVLFADIVNFTVLSSQMSPAAVVKMLNEVFSHFDELTEKYGLEKIKTIGDCYMVAAGVPIPRYDHAQALANLALDIRAFSQSYQIFGQPLQFRIGINSGPVTAGVIGRKKFIYDLWGDAVNTASRMESHGMGGTIQITQATYDLIQQEFDCQRRGSIEIKGKGKMNAYWLRQKRPPDLKTLDPKTWTETPKIGRLGRE